MKKIYPSALMVLFVVGCTGRPLQLAEPAASLQPAASPPPTSALPAPADVEPGTGASLSEEPSSTAGHVSPTVRILDAGAGPRKQLRYKLRPGAVDHAQIDVKLKMSIAMATSPGRKMVAIDMPTMRLGYRTAVTEALPGGAVRLAFEVEDMRLLGDGSFDHRTRSAVETELAGMVGIRGSTRMSARGEETKFVFDYANASPTQQEHLDRMQNSLHDTFVRFPEAAVGIGARWEVTSSVRSGLFMVDRKVIFTLKRLSGSAATLDFEITMSASSQTLQLRTGQTGMLHSFEGHGSGTTTIGLDRFAQAATAKSSAAATFSIGSGAEAVDASMDLDLGMALSTKPSVASRR
jgi:hypothetical protein